MQTNFEKLFHQAEDHYLNPSEIKTFKTQVGVLAERLETYKLLRNQEIDIFQPIADDLFNLFPETNLQILETAIKHWLCVMRFGAMAMLLNNPDYFEHRLLEWITGMIHAHEMEVVEQHLYELLENQLQQTLDQEQFALFKPFLIQASTTLLKQKMNNQLVMVGEEA